MPTATATANHTNALRQTAVLYTPLTADNNNVHRSAVYFTS